MKKLLLAVALLSLASLNFVNFAKAEDTVRKELEAVYAKIDAAIKARDFETLESLLSEDYERRQGDKTTPREEVVAEMKEGMKKIKAIVSIKTTIDKIRQVEGNQIVDYTQTGKATVTSDGKDITVDVTSKGRDWWVKDEDGEWICVAAERVE